MASEVGPAAGFDTELREPPNNYIEYLASSGMLDAFRGTARSIYDLGWAPGNAGNISIRETRRRGRFFITATGSHFKELSPRDIVFVEGLEIEVGDERIRLGNNLGDSMALAIASLRNQGFTRQVLDGIGAEEITINNLTRALKYMRTNGIVRCIVKATGFKNPSSETLLHGLIYAKRWGWLEEVNGIIHCHKPGGGRGVSATPTPFSEIGYGNMELAVEAVQALKKEDLAVLTDHGMISVTSEYHNEKEYGSVLSSALEKITGAKG